MHYFGKCIQAQERLRRKDKRLLFIYKVINRINREIESFWSSFLPNDPKPFKTEKNL